MRDSSALARSLNWLCQGKLGFTSSFSIQNADKRCVSFMYFSPLLTSQQVCTHQAMPVPLSGLFVGELGLLADGAISCQYHVSAVALLVTGHVT